jgi:phosphatidylinositol glycan class A protein
MIVVTHAHPPHRRSVRYLPCGLKVYYLPLRLIPPANLHATLPNLFLAFPLLRQVFVRESIDIVHAHGALSALGLEAILHARTLGLRAVFTDHSLLGFGGVGEMWGNKMLKGVLSDIEAVICVSHTG